MNQSPNAEPTSARRRGTFAHKLLLAMTAVLAGGILTLRHVYRTKYPFGGSHCCAKCLASALQMYATDNEGRYPAGGPTPDASLSLLVGHGSLGGTNGALEILRGKTVPLAQVLAAWKTGGRLEPASCGWFYVEGLTSADAPELALAWDKFGLSHNGERFASGGHEVITIGGYDGYITGDRWEAFIKEQQTLLAHQNPPLNHALNGWTTNYALRDSRSETKRK